MTKIPLVNPERFLDALAPCFLWLTSGPAFVGWMIGLGIAIQQLLTHADQLSLETAQILAPNNSLWLIVTWLALKAVHEFFHALVCRKYGGHVHEAGMVLIVFAPIFYVDVTSSWRFPSKWEKIFTAAAGMYSELFIGAMAAIIWVHTPPGMANQLALNVVLLTTVTTLVFNANPLMKFDGYYILSDLVEIPNLAPQGQDFLSYFGRRYFYGVELGSPCATGVRGQFVRLYGILAMCWRIFITVSIGLAAATLFDGAGLALVLVSLMFWIGMPIASNASYFLFGRDNEQPSRLRFVSLLVIAGASFLAAWYWTPSPMSVKAHAIVDYQPRSVVRTEVEGFVTKVLVEPGQVVVKGQLLAVLRNESLRSEVEVLEFAYEASRTRERVYSRVGDIAALQAESEGRRALELQLNERKLRLSHLDVLAPTSGQIVSHDLDLLVGTYLREGHELLVIGDERRKELVLSISQQDAALFHAHQGSPVNVRMTGGKREKFSAAMGEIEPTAAMKIDHMALGAAGGGPLPVRPQTVNQGKQQADAWEFVQPRVKGSIALDKAHGDALRAGQLALVKLPTARETLGEAVYRSTERWVRKRLRRQPSAIFD